MFEAVSALLFVTIKFVSLRFRHSVTPKRCRISSPFTKTFSCFNIRTHLSKFSSEILLHSVYSSSSSLLCYLGELAGQTVNCVTCLKQRIEPRSVSSSRMLYRLHCNGRFAANEVTNSSVHFSTCCCMQCLCIKEGY